MRRRTGAATVAVALVVALGACGVGAGDDQEVSLLVTRDFGSRTVSADGRVKAPESDTVLRLLERGHEVDTRFGGGFVQTIDGAKAGTSAGRPVDWFFYVNGSLASKGAASVRLHRGDRVWWDLHDWSGTADVGAVVGSFPEPFAHGDGGDPPAVTLVCAPAAYAACVTTRRRLRSAGTRRMTQVATGDSQATAGVGVRVLVGTWSALRADPVARRLEHGPAGGGVFARPAADGRSIALLDPRGRAARTLRAGGGLVAAAGRPGDRATWLVTGVDADGVARAVAALTAAALDGRFALALPRSGDGVALPVAP